MQEPKKNPELPLPLPPEVADLNTEVMLEKGLTPLEKKDLANQEVGAQLQSMEKSPRPLKTTSPDGQISGAMTMRRQNGDNRRRHFAGFFDWDNSDCN